MVSRKECLQRLREKSHDLLIIGGGAVGAGIALDAALRGLDAALIEKNDFSSGTSSRSTKLIHGGVRYLESAFLHLDLSQFRLVQEALKERSILLRIAPHLTRKLPIIIPIYSYFEAVYYRTGMAVYDWLAGKQAQGMQSSFLSKEETIEAFPEIKRQGLKGGIQLFDGQFDDARMNLSIILTAIDQGAAAANYVELIGFEKKEGKIIGAMARDAFDGEIFEIRSKVFINAAGPFADLVRGMDNPSAKPIIAGSAGSHLVVDSSFTPSGKGLLIPHTADGRVLFLLPWRGATLIGTTDIPSPVSDHPKPSRGEIHYLLEEIKEHLGIEIHEDQIKASWAGIRPLVAAGAKQTSRLSRGFTILHDPSGLYTIVGGKWTTYRKMAETLMEELVRKGECKRGKCCATRETMLLGGEGYSAGLADSLCREFGIENEIAHHLAQSYGGRAGEVIRLAEEVQGKERISKDYPYLAGEIAYAVRHEMASRPADIMFRRTRLAALDQKAAEEALSSVIALMAKELNWSPAEQQQEYENYLNEQRF